MSGESGTSLSLERMRITELFSCPRIRQHQYLGTKPIEIPHFWSVRGHVLHENARRIYNGEPLLFPNSINEWSPAQRNSFKLGLENLEKWFSTKF